MLLPAARAIMPARFRAAPEDILAKIVAGGLSATPVGVPDREIERRRDFRAARLTEMAPSHCGDFEPTSPAR